jgi:hypothetical protein
LAKRILSDVISRCNEGPTMPDYLFLMHNDAVQPVDQAKWEPYLARLRRTGALRGGSEIGGGVCLRKSGAKACLTDHLRGFIRVAAASIDAAQALVQGNPVFEAGGTVEIRDLPQS